MVFGNNSIKGIAAAKKLFVKLDAPFRADASRDGVLYAERRSLVGRLQIQVPLQFVDDIGQLKPGLQPANDRQYDKNSGQEI
jgi:hypothetical protein